MLKVVFFGSPDFAVPSLNALIKSTEIDVCAVVTQPDKPAGRGKKLTSPPVKVVAESAGLEVRQPRSVRGKKFAAWVSDFNADYFVVVAYGKILPLRILETPNYGCVNLHSSLLPAYRGAAPINWALMDGLNETGVSTMLMDVGMDTGPVLMQDKIEIPANITVGELTPMLAELGAPLLLESLKLYVNQEIKPTAQDELLASHASLLSKDDGKINWSMPAEVIMNRWQGLTPWPGISTSFRDGVMKLKKLILAPEKKSDLPSGSLLVEKNRLFLVCFGGSVLEVLEAQLPGKRALPAPDLINGAHLKTGERCSA